MITKAEGHRNIALIDHGHAQGSGVALQVVVHQDSEIEGVEELGQGAGLQDQGHAVGADALHFPGAQVSHAVDLHGIGLAVEDVHAVVGLAAVGEQHRDTEAGAVALAEVGAAGPDVLVAVQGKAGDHAAALGGDGQGSFCHGVGDDILLKACAALGDVLGGNLVHKLYLHII